ncbi:amidohydrolase family protein [Cupriavidus consociatus]|uniref:amidohydrolase family protein n=1 Tax=Cupriavidus consociatus TaxID=2821357 RepID=UPI001AE5DD35|nr:MULTISPECIES: amidohydrolase family protein [unclassified Cupriavidus]MBP0621155.1 amidohydrolase [Cupriavidus sp. LEh25]MDK2657825.1 amidohydrolase family protein [Cupriavidus sp. LEh21]
MTEIIDAWMQLPNKEYLLNPMFDSLRRWPTNWSSLALDNPSIKHEEVMDLFRSQGVTRAIASAWWGPAGPMITNDEVAAAVRAHPGQLVGVASVDISRAMDAVRELRRCVKEFGFKGLRVLPWLWGLPPDDRRYYPLYAECIELDITFCLQVGHAGPMCPSEPGRPIPYLDNVAHEFPELRIVGGHIGFPWVAEMISLMMKHPNVYVDTSAYKASRFPQELISYMRGPGKKKVLYGTNYPMLTPAECLADIDALDLGDEVKQLFLADNARRAFKLEVA